MCGRFTLNDTNPTVLRQRFSLPDSVEVSEQPRFNIAPTDPVLAIRRGAEGVRDAGRLRWGLIPGHWAAEKKGRPLINARAESLTEQPAFRDAFRERRCLIPADGFYEWRVTEDGKQPMWISRADEALWAFAGIWAELERKEGVIHSCAIVTCEPNELIRPIHDRMPVILARDAEAAWIDPDMDEDELMKLLGPFADAELTAREVSDAVNDVREDGPHLLEPPLKLF